MSDERKVFHKPLFDQISEVKRRTILQVAAEEFAERGFVQANVNTIAERSLVSVGSLYKYFSGKESLYLTVVQTGFEMLDAALSPILASPDSLFDKISRIIDAIFLHSRENRTLTRLYNRFTTEGNPELAARLAESIETFTASNYASLLKTARDEGIIGGAVDERMLAFCMDNIFLVLQFSLSGEYYHDRMHIYLGDDLAGNPERLKDQLMLFFRQAIGIR